MKKKTTKPAIKKKAVMVKKTIAKKRPVASKKIIVKTGKKQFKPFGIFVAIGGALGLVLLVTVGMTNLIQPKTDQPVLGASTAVKVSKPSSVKTSAVTDGIKVSWETNETNVQSFKIWRKTGLFGTRQIIAVVMRPQAHIAGGGLSVELEPAKSFVDTTAQKNKLYTYYVATTKVNSGYNPAYETTTSGATSSGIILSKANGTNIGVLSIKSETARSMTVNAKVSKTRGIFYELFVSCSSNPCDSSKQYVIGYSRNFMQLNQEAAFGNQLGALTYLYNSSSDYVKVGLLGLAPGKEYSIRVYQLSVTGFDPGSPGVIDSTLGTVTRTQLGSERKISTLATAVAPAKPTGLTLQAVYDNAIGTHNALFLMNLPSAPVDGVFTGLYAGYDAALSCSNASVGTWGWNTNFGYAAFKPYSSTQQSLELEDYPTQAGNCTMKVKSYNMGSGDVKVYSPEAVYTYTQ